MADKYEPELGQMCFGQPSQELAVSNILEAALREISREWDRVMWNINQKELANPFENTGAKWKCNDFEVEAYDWNDENEQAYNFKWNDIKISWYKYLGRGMSPNREISNDEISKMLDDCLVALRNYEKEQRPDLNGGQENFIAYNEKAQAMCGNSCTSADAMHNS